VKHWIDTQKLDINKKDKYEKTILFYACESNFVSVAKYLLDKGAKIELLDYQPLCETCHNYSIEMVKMLIEHGADVNGKDHEGNRPLHWLLRCGKDDSTLLDMISLFFKHGLKLNERDSEGDSYLHLSTRYGHVWATRELIALGSSLEITNNKGNTVLLNCCENSWGWNMNCFRLIFNKKGNMKAKNIDGNNALHIASKNGMVSLVKFLCSHLPIDEINNSANSALMEGCYGNRNISSLQHIISYGARLDIVNSSGLTALQLAMMNFNLDVVYLLISRLNRKEMVESISTLLPDLNSVYDEMIVKKINLDQVEKEISQK
jgi:ankyrin repeat protein